jgi:hypothetical protein
MEAPGSWLHPTFDNVMGFLGLIAGVVGIWYAVRADQKLQKVREAKKQVERKFLHTMASQEFGKIAVQATAMSRAARNSDWETLTGLVDETGAALLRARGARGRLLKPDEKDQLDVAISTMQYYNARLPLPEETDVELERVQELIAAYQALKDTASELSGRFEVESEVEQED